MLSKYLYPTVHFKELPDDLKNTLISRFLLSVLAGIFVAACGIASSNILILGIAGLTILMLILYCYFPYFLATRDLIVQISGCCVEKNTDIYIGKAIKMDYLIVAYEDKEISVCVRHKTFKQISEGQIINLYVLPDNILPKDNGYLIINYLFLIQKKNG